MRPYTGFLACLGFLAVHSLLAVHGFSADMALLDSLSQDNGRFPSERRVFKPIYNDVDEDRYKNARPSPQQMDVTLQSLLKESLANTRRAATQQKRDFNPWGGKRGFEPWSGKRSLPAALVISHLRRQFGGVPSRVESKRVFSPWAGKRSSDPSSGDEEWQYDYNTLK